MHVAIKKAVRTILPKKVVEALIYLKHSRSRLPNHETYAACVAGKKGLEIGGPSMLFKTTLPLYQIIKDLDGVNFSTHTAWEGSIKAGRHFNFIGAKKGMQFIAEASDLTALQDQSYEFLLSSNCLEHVANPIKALMEWKRVIQPGGALILVLPNKAGNFDHKRPTTPLAHLVEDFEKGTSEHDLTHLDEILALHDLSMDPPAGTPEQFRTRSLDNFNNRTLHHHVFDLDVMRGMLTHAGFDVVETTATDTDFFALAKKPL
jgi:SAM-dependent methyltransferase